VREKQVPAVIVELLTKAMQRLVQREIWLAHWAEPAAPYLAAEERPARATLRQALFALPA
jgi:hypothetical protein